jgi:hypothetical protein
MKREDWEPEYDDEPRTDGKSALDLFAESCQAADAARKRQNHPFGPMFEAMGYPPDWTPTEAELEAMEKASASPKATDSK